MNYGLVESADMPTGLPNNHLTVFVVAFFISKTNLHYINFQFTLYSTRQNLNLL